MEVTTRRAVAALLILACFLWETATATPLHFRIDAGFDCYDEGSGCDAFAEDTGLAIPWIAPFTARFTVNSAQLPATPVSGPVNEYDDQPGQNWLVNGNVEISVGDLVMHFSQYYMRLASYQLDGPGSIFAIWGRSGDQGFFFTMSDKISTHFTKHTVDELAVASMKNYQADSFMPAAVSLWIGHDGRWSAPQREETPFSIRRVPEPHTFALFVIGVIGIFLAQRRRLI